MRKIFIIGIFLFLVFISMSYADFYVRTLIIKRCPTCSRAVLAQPGMEVEDQSTQCWTDGKCHTILFPEAPWLVKCPHCFKLFWVEDAEEAGERKLSAEGSKDWFREWPKEWEVYPPSEVDYYAILNTGLKDREREKYCRMRVWWCVNEDKRSGRDIEFSQDAIRNLEALYELLMIDNEEERITKAEIARELGRFEEAISLLDFQFKNELPKRVVLIKTLAQRQDSMVRPIKRWMDQ